MVLNATGGRRVFEIKSGGTVELIGLNITGGYASSVQSVCLFEPFAQTFPPSPHWYAHCLRCVVAVRSEFWRQLEPTHVTFHRPDGTLRARFFTYRAEDFMSTAPQR